MGNEIRSAIDFYDQHPISAQIILTKLQAERGTLDGLRPDELFLHDQDHYGGLAANDDLAKCAQISSGTKVVDLCAGLGGPARYLAYRYGAFVTGIELTPARVAGATELTQRVGLGDKVKVIEGDVTTLPLASGSQDAVISQEALLHVAEFARALGEAYRVLRPGGRFAFTNWIAHQPLSAENARLLWDGMAAATLISIDRHAELLRSVGFAIDKIDDETDAWGPILADRLRMYQKLRGEAEQAGAPSGRSDFYKSYVLFVDLVQKKMMGGARFSATKPAYPACPPR
jgi:sarcosine/dimethylglycine N-methyltransferase